jgi:hypothetical protein
MIICAVRCGAVGNVDDDHEIERWKARERDFSQASVWEYIGPWR